MASIARYWHTLRHLRAVQVYGRVWFRLARPAVDAAPAPAQRKCTGQWVAPIARPSSILNGTTARFLGKTRAIDSRAIWNDTTLDKLWLYNLHYFDDLSCNDGAAHTALQSQWIERWITENPPPHGNGWEPYPTSLRIVNWIKWSLAGNTLSPRALDSLATQARWLRVRVEHHLLANHLFVNAKALIFAGHFFDDPQSQEWLAEGVRILRREIPEQILPDGGHFERSPMYHAIILEDLLDLLNAASVWSGQVDAQTITACKNTIPPMLDYLAAMSHPDGEIAFFNDAASGIAANTAQLDEYAQRLAITGRPLHQPTPLQQLQPSGYIRAVLGPAVLIADVAPVGPDYQPGHAHADTLSFELSLHGQRVIVNSGTSTYAIGRQRTHERSTAAHNTLEIDGRDSSEVWGGFRVARRARVIECVATASVRGIEIEAAHDGYRRMIGGAVHHRRWELSENALIITDTIRGAFTCATAHLYLHPSVTQLANDRVQLADGRALSFIVRGGILRMESASWHPEFGVDVGSHVVICSMTAPEMTLELRWN